MSPQDFLANFHEIANAPGGVARLREVVLHLAINGSLIDPISTKETGAALLSDVRRQCLEAGSKDYGVVGRDEEPFPLPSHWCWVRMGNLALSSDSGWSPQCESTPRRGSQWGVLKVSAVSWGKFAPEENKALPSGMAPRTECEVKVGDFLLSRANTEDLVAKSVVVESTPPHLMMSDKIVRFTFSDKVDKRFINLAHSSAHVRAHYAHNASGTSSSMKNVGRNVMCIAPIPLPPLAEQKRIVAKVDELMALCDALEAQQQERDRLFPRLSHATHTRLTDSPSQPHLDSLFTDLSSISPEDMRRSIQSLAVLGKLAPQDPTEPALACNHHYKRPSGEAVLSKEQFISDLPANWTWIRFEWLGEIFGGLTPSMAKSEFWHGDIPWVSPKDMHTKTLRSAEMHVTAKALEQTSLKLVPPGSLLFVTRSGILRRTLPVVLTEVECVVNQDLKVLVPHDSNITTYVQLLLRGFEALILTELVKTGTTVQSVIFDAFRKKAFPFPPLAEQRRIVAKVEELMALVSTLEAQQQEKSRLAESFAQACVTSITGTRIETRERMKAPKTQLVSRVRLGNPPPADANAPLALLIFQTNDGEIDAKALWQQSKLSIDEFYCQLRTELAAGWIAPPQEAQVLEVDASTGTAGFLRAAGEYLKEWHRSPSEVLETMAQLTEANDQAAAPSQRNKRSKRK